MYKKTKIVATIGPATESVEMLERMLKAGMNVMRLNFSHGDFAEHQKRVDNLRVAMKNTGFTCAILQDLGGPKIRIGDFSTEIVNLKEGNEFVITTEDVVGDEKIVSINYSPIIKEVKKGHLIFLDDGKRKLEVKNVKGNKVICRILVGGEIRGRRGVNLPNSELSIKALSPKDVKDLEFGLKNEIDFFALSFVRSSQDIHDLKKILIKRKSTAGIIAKIETPQAIENIDDIIKISDGIMVARGDLAIEVPFEKVPSLQKTIIGKCNSVGKPVITATHLLESMIDSPVATRAEVSDVANAILDGSDAVMLSKESTLGKYPIEAVNVMTQVAYEIESDFPEKPIVRNGKSGETDVSDSLTSSIVKTAHDIGAKAIVALTDSGFTARMISRHRPQAPILALTPFEKTAVKLSLVFGTYSIVVERYETLEDVFKIVRLEVSKNNLAKKGDKVVIAAGVPFGTKGLSTNLMVVQVI
jgi:pyruvate kinase